MIEPISPASRDAGTWQARIAAMQQQLTQKLFQATDVNGDGAISKSEFESFYSKFTGAAGAANGASETTAADQLFQQLDTQGTGQLNATQFAAAMKLLTAQPAQGPQHLVSQSRPSQASPDAAQWLGGLFSAAPARNTATPSEPPQNAGTLEFIA